MFSSILRESFIELKLPVVTGSNVTLKKIKKCERICDEFLAPEFALEKHLWLWNAGFDSYGFFSSHFHFGKAAKNFATDYILWWQTWLHSWSINYKQEKINDWLRCLVWFGHVWLMYQNKPQTLRVCSVSLCPCWTHTEILHCRYTLRSAVVSSTPLSLITSHTHSQYKETDMEQET